MDSEKMEKMRLKVAKRAEKRQKKDDAPYLNSITRVTSRLVISILEYILVFILISLLMTYLKTGSIDFNALPDVIKEYLSPGGAIFTALVAFLPVMILENIGIYFGLGSVPRMLFGMVKYLVLIWWLHMFVGAAGDIDIIQMSGMAGSSALNGVESVTMNLAPFVKLLDIIFLLCLIIPVGEFIGCRRRHNEAVLRQQERREAKKAEKEDSEDESDDGSDDESAEPSEEKE